MMKLYRVKHKKTGLYFKPSNGGCNLSFKGKVYQGVPPFAWFKEIRISPWATGMAVKAILISSGLLDMNPNPFHPTNKYVSTYVTTERSDWEIEEIETKEE